MHFFSFINTLVDLAMICAMCFRSRPVTVGSQPLALMVAASAAPYTFNIYPMLFNAAVFGVDMEQMHDVRQAQRTFEAISNRDATFRSVWLGTYTIFIVLIGALLTTRLLRCVRDDRRMSRGEWNVRMGAALLVALFACMAFYNHLFDLDDSQLGLNAAPFVLLVLGHLAFLATLVYGKWVMRGVKEPTERQAEAIACIVPLHLFSIVITVPIGFMAFQMVSLRHKRFMFSDHEMFTRLMFFTSLFILEPFSTRLSFYRNTRAPVAPAPVAPAPLAPSRAPAVQAAAAQPLPKKMALPDMPPTYDSAPAPPSYDTARGLPTTWTITPPSREYTGVPLTPVETH